MPELPEVETIRLGLQKYLVGHTIEDVEVKLPRIVTGDIQSISGAKITKVERFGKGLVIELNNNFCIAIHVKLTGQLIYQDAASNAADAKGAGVSKGKVGTVPNKFTHVIFSLDKGGMLYYNDFRQFGWIKIVETDDLKTLEFFRDLGPEFFKDLTLEKFIQALSSSSSPVKVIIMDQKRISGVGNIYANDGLNLAKIDPRRSAKKLTKEEAKTLFDALETVLKKGIETGGASELSYVNALGQEGSYQDHFLTYAREGQPCKNCGNKLIKIKLGGRGTYYCPKCQK